MFPKIWGEQAYWLYSDSTAPPASGDQRGFSRHYITQKLSAFDGLEEDFVEKWRPRAVIVTLAGDIDSIFAAAEAVSSSSRERVNMSVLYECRNSRLPWRHRSGTATMCSFISAASMPQITRFSRQEASPQPPSEEDSAVRKERSTNLSYITGTARKIRMYIKNRHLQLLPDGIVNGTSDDHNVYSESSVISDQPCDNIYM
ncbi:hypothetical protein FQR65_LT08298 [Abscondita terminalis]|nr:hypothetical protein FQR65_LT08298 [Abscondita terminalis]